jgi:lysozyme family protein
MSHFEEAVAAVLKAEGGLLISDSEHGGGANFGVSLTVLQEHRKNKSLTLDDLKVMTVEEAKEIYRVRYWDAISGDMIKGRLMAIALLDQAVNRGSSGARNFVNTCLVKRFKRQQSSDWEIIVSTINQIDDRIFFRRLVCDAQLEYVDLAINSSSKKIWLKGWLTRTHNLLKLLV